MKLGKTLFLTFVERDIATGETSPSYLQEEVPVAAEDLYAELPEESGLLACQEVIKRPHCNPPKPWLAWLATTMAIWQWEGVCPGGLARSCGNGHGNGMNLQGMGVPPCMFQIYKYMWPALADEVQ